MGIKKWLRNFEDSEAIFDWIFLCFEGQYTVEACAYPPHRRLSLLVILVWGVVLVVIPDIPSLAASETSSQGQAPPLSKDKHRCLSLLKILAWGVRLVVIPDAPVLAASETSYARQVPALRKLRASCPAVVVARNTGLRRWTGCYP